MFLFYSIFFQVLTFLSLSEVTLKAMYQGGIKKVVLDKCLSHFTAQNLNT